ncbi:MAG: exostosin family protein [Candidatus Peregrinibacteria bacterium]
MKTVFTRILPGRPIIPFLYPTVGTEERGSILFLRDAFQGLDSPFVRITDDPAECDALLLAHNFPSIRHETASLEEFAALSKRTGKKIVVFWHGDSDSEVPLPNAVVLRTSLYGATRRPNEIAMPAYSPDLLSGAPLPLREKSAVPTVGFCGWAEYRSLKNLLGTLVMNALTESRAILSGNSLLRARKKGLSFRRRAIRSLQESSAVRSNFLIRRSYSGHRDTIHLDPEQARREYIANLRDCDFALVVKGDGNYSYRFYEALSLGRIPLLLDTDCVLPRADSVPYDDIMVRVDFREIGSIADRVRAAFDAMSAEEFVRRQKRAREVFEKFLSVKAFFRYVAERLI